MKILILGGTRFIGRTLIEKLITCGLLDIAMLNRGTRDIKFSAPVKQLLADRNDSVAMKSALDNHRFDVVFDLSADSSSHIENVLRVRNFRFDHYIFCSSIAVCKQPPAYWPITENHEKCEQLSDDSYGFNKLQAELSLQENAGGKWVSIVRPTYVYGPFNYAKREMLIFEQLSQGLPIHISGSGDNIIQFGYVEDLANAFIEIVGNPKAKDQTFNISGNELVTVNQFISMIGNVFGCHVEAIPNCNDSDRSVYLPPIHRFADISKAVNILGFKPKATLREGIERSLEWWKIENGKEKEK